MGELAHDDAQRHMCNHGAESVIVSPVASSPGLGFEETFIRTARSCNLRSIPTVVRV